MADIRTPPKFVPRPTLEINLRNQVELLREYVNIGIEFTRILITSYDEMAMEFGPQQEIPIREQNVRNDTLVLTLQTPFNFSTHYVYACMLYFDAEHDDQTVPVTLNSL
jgi:hypothetical protein